MWEQLHYLASGQTSPCTAVGVCGGVSLVTGGEDGRMNVIEVESQKVTRSIGKKYYCVFFGIKSNHCYIEVRLSFRNQGLVYMLL